MDELFDKFEYNSANCKSWHIRKRMLEHCHYDNQMLQFYDYGEINCSRTGEEPLYYSGNNDSWGFYFVTAGTCRCRRNTDHFQLRKYDLLLLEPGKNYFFEVLGKQKLVIKKLFFMDTPVARFLANSLLQTDFLHINEHGELLKIFDRLESLLIAPSRMSLRDLGICVYSLLAEVARQCPDSESVLTIHSIVSEVECTPWNNYDIPELAKKCSLSTRSFQWQFKSFTGHNFLTYLTNCKIHLACRLLQNENYSIKDIIRICNFRSHPYFYQLFKAVTGVSPASYRKNLSGDRFFETGLRNMESRIFSPEELTEVRKNILWYIWGNRHISISSLASILSIHRSAVQKHIQYLKVHGYLVRTGSARAGYWSLGKKYKSFFSGYTPEKLKRISQKKQNKE